MPPMHSSDDGERSRWRELQFAGWPELCAFSDTCRSTLPVGGLYEDLEYTAVAHGWPDKPLLVLAHETDGRLDGLCAFTVDHLPLAFAVGPVVLMRRRTRRYHLFQGPVLASQDDDTATSSCFAHLAGQMPADAAAFAFAVPVESRLYAQLTDPRSPIRRLFHVLPWGAEQPSCAIRWQGSVEQFLSTISANSRHDLRRRRKKFLADAAAHGTVRCFQSAAEVDEFLRDGIRISGKTWQKAEHGAGLALDSAYERKIRHAAARNAFLGYILYLDGEPAAFQYCLLFGATCMVEQIGYDPASTRRHHVGSILFFEVLHDFERRRLPVTLIDFSSTATFFKLRTTNTRFQVRNFYLFKRSAAGAALYAGLRCTDALSRGLGRLAERFGIKRSVLPPGVSAAGD